MTTVFLRTSATLLALAMLAACGGHTPHPASAPPPPTVVGVTPADIDAAFALLLEGDEGGARKQVERLLKRDPSSANARLLLDSIERDPTDLLGPASYSYSVRAGDTPVTLAERLLGNRLKAYQLIRYNGLKAPVTLLPGQVVRIPGEPPRPEPVRRSEPATPRASSVSAPSRPWPATGKTGAAPATAANPAAARTVRAAGLAALNGGDLNRAVTLLRRAAALDPGNPLIARDLVRAERIAATVRARR